MKAVAVHNQIRVSYKKNGVSVEICECTGVLVCLAVSVCVVWSKLGHWSLSYGAFYVAESMFR